MARFSNASDTLFTVSQRSKSSVSSSYTEELGLSGGFGIHGEKCFPCQMEYEISPVLFLLSFFFNIWSPFFKVEAILCKSGKAPYHNDLMSSI